MSEKQTETRNNMKINESSYLSIGLSAMLAVTVFSAGSYVTAIQAQGKSITDLQERADRNDRDRKEFLLRYNNDITEIKISLARIQTSLERKK